ncbi:MAG: hypothetical protein HC778_01500 [Chamaesiphon sp. CSU_1_12]|nr:hypothetical protein [Chamaesiphon sp. CSU_1_12]
MLNLVNNAIKFTATGGVTIACEATAISDNNYEIHFLVRDTGIGIDENDLTKIFNSFYRGRNAIASEIEGAGLGLTIVQQLLNRCDGSISVTSKLGKGSTF